MIATDITNALAKTSDPTTIIMSASPASTPIYVNHNVRAVILVPAEIPRKTTLST
jgi:hypothetical protein